MRCPHQASYQIAGGMRREGEPQGRGVMNAMDVVEKKKCAAKAQKIPVAPGVDDRHARPRSRLSKRTTWPSSCRTTIANLVRYQYKVGSLGRQYSSPLGAQRCSNLVRANVLPPAVEDFDMVNAMTNLVVQAVRKMPLLAAVTRVEQLVRLRRPHHGDPWTVAGFPGREDEGGHPRRRPRLCRSRH